MSFVTKFANVWRFVSSDKLSLLLLGFLFTTLIRSWLNSEFQRTPWEREKKFEVLRQDLFNGFALIEDISSLSNRRFFDLQHVMWSLQGADVKKAKEIWLVYYNHVIDWNRVNHSLRWRMSRLIGEQYAAEFLNYQDENTPDSPRSIHGSFKLAHDRVLELLNCIDAETCDPDDENRAARAIADLDIHVDDFLDRASLALIQRADSLKFNPSMLE